MSVKEKKWDRKSYMGVEINGKTLGIVGCGRIGQVVSSIAQGMGMHVIGYDPVMTSDQLKEVNIECADLEDIWAKSDFITVHTPLTPETSNLINDVTIDKCKKGVRIINCARGGIVDEAALLRGLESGKVAGAALDVFTSEPPKEHLKSLIAHPNLVCTPHLGASTDEAQVSQRLSLQYATIISLRTRLISYHPHSLLPSHSTYSPPIYYPSLCILYSSASSSLHPSTFHTAPPTLHPFTGQRRP